MDEITAKVIRLIEQYENKTKLMILDMCIGLKYAYCIVKGTKEAMGLSYVLIEDIQGHEEPKELEDVFSMIKSTKMLDRILALAYLNSASQYILWVEKDHSCEILENKVSNYIMDKIDKKDKIVVIGNMWSLIERLSKKTRNIWVFERNPKMRTQGALPDCFEYRHLKESDVVIVSGTALLNDTIDPILRYSERAHTKIVVGPTAQMHPDVLLKYFDVVASLKVNDIEATKRVIKLGGGRWSFSKFCSDYIAVF